MSDHEKTSVAALISVILRRKLGRVVDVKWLIKNEAYANEIIKLSREQGLDDLTSYANNLEALMFGAINPIVSAAVTKTNTEIGVRIPSDTKVAIKDDDDGEKELDLSKYIGHLR